MKKLLNSKVSVIITCYNYGQYIEEAILSVIHQSYKNIEVIVIDDGSTDNTKDVCSKFSKQIRYVFQNNAGVANARNKGIELSKGEYVVMLDADDKLEKNYVSECLKKIFSTSARYVYTDMRMFGSQNKIHRAIEFDPIYLVTKGNYIHAGALIEKEAFNMVGGYSNFEAFEDWDLWLKFLELGMEGSYTDKTIYYYRRHRGSRDDISGIKKEKIMKKIRASHPDLIKKYSYIEPGIIGFIKKYAKKR